MKNIDNPLSEYQPPSKEALRNFGIDISRETAEKYALKMFGRLPQSQDEMTFSKCSKIVEETGEGVISVAFDLGFETGEIPIAMVFENHNGQTYIRKLLKYDKALELHRLLTE